MHLPAAHDFPAAPSQGGFLSPFVFDEQWHVFQRIAAMILPVFDDFGPMGLGPLQRARVPVGQLIV
jgi:hypothetical protein